MRGLDTMPLFATLLAAAGGSSDSIALTPSASQQPAVFSLADMPEYVAGVSGPDEFAYGLGYLVEVDFTATQSGGTGAIIPYDELFKVIDSCELSCETLGGMRQSIHVSGAELGNLDQIVACNYNRPQPVRAAIAAANGANAVHLEVWVPLALLCFANGATDTSVWTGFMKKNGKLTLNGFRSDCLASISTGCTVSAVTVRAGLAYYGAAEARIHVPYNMCRYTPPTGAQVALTDIGTPKGLQTIDKGPAGLALMVWESNLRGLAGPDTVEKITGVHEPQLRQGRMTRPGWKVSLARLLSGGEGVGPRSGVTTTIVDDAVGFGTTLSETPIANPMRATKLWYEHVIPGRNARLSKVRLAPKGININYDFSATPSGSHAIRTWELLRHTYEAKVEMARMMGFTIDEKSFAAGTYRFAKRTLEKQDPAHVDPRKSLFFADKIIANKK